MDLETVWRHVESERRGVADLLAGLSPGQWEAPSLCEGWRVRDVAAHLTLSTRMRPLTALRGLARARGNLNAYVAADASARSDESVEHLVDTLRSVAASRTHPPGTRPVDPLVDVLVHGQDIAVPLGVERSMPTDAAVAAADRVWSMGFPFRAKKRLAGLRLRASNAEWSRGEGPELEGPIESVLLLLAGRAAGLTKLQGQGRQVLEARQ